MRGGSAVGEVPEQRYIDALMADLEAALPLIWGRSVHSIFIGGGTPSLFRPQAIDRLLSDIRARLRLEADCEITWRPTPALREANVACLPQRGRHAPVHWGAELQRRAPRRPWAA